MKTLKVYNHLKSDILNIPDVLGQSAELSAAFYKAALMKAKRCVCGQDMQPSLKLHHIFVSVS